MCIKSCTWETMALNLIGQGCGVNWCSALIWHLLPLLNDKYALVCILIPSHTLPYLQPQPLIYMYSYKRQLICMQLKKTTIVGKGVNLSWERRSWNGGEIEVKTDKCLRNEFFATENENVCIKQRSLCRLVSRAVFPKNIDYRSISSN